MLKDRIVWAPVRTTRFGLIADTSGIVGVGSSLYPDLSKDPVVAVAEVRQKRRFLGSWKSCEVLQRVPVDAKR